MDDEEKKKASFASVPRFSFKGIEQSVKVVRVVDGDTCYIVADYYGKLVNLKCRLKGIDCAEMKKGSLDVNGRPGSVARDFLAHLCTGGEVRGFDYSQAPLTKEELERKLNGSRTLIYAILGEFDCFGRVLVTLKKTKSSRKSFSQILKDNGYSKDTREKTRSLHIR